MLRRAAALRASRIRRRVTVAQDPRVRTPACCGRHLKALGQRAGTNLAVPPRFDVEGLAAAVLLPPEAMRCNPNPQKERVFIKKVSEQEESGRASRKRSHASQNGQAIIQYGVPSPPYLYRDPSTSRSELGPPPSICTRTGPPSSTTTGPPSLEALKGWQV